jgi:A/G-specific adenine glycosylase
MCSDILYDDSSIVRDFHDRYIIGGRGLIASDALKKFRVIIYGYYRKHKRDFPWRHTDDPYHILVSEVMLQQTQTGRVAEKYVEFINAFPTVEALAAASMQAVMAVWQGMGYNRRVRYLRELAALVVTSHGGLIPETPEELALLPGIGKATAASICAFAFNRPVVFIETNIRAVFIHFFFHSGQNVSDRDILPLAEEALDRKEPRHWYSALMDYGAMIKKRNPNPSRKSVHHQKQKPFEGSRRQLRGLVLRTLLDHPGITVKRLSLITGKPVDIVASVIDDLAVEGLVRRKGNVLNI